MGSLQGDYNSSANLTRMSAWRNWMYRLFDRYIFPTIPRFDEFMLTHVVAKTISNSFVFNFIDSILSGNYSMETCHGSTDL
ncbi:hypothetical protein F4801DRAFT_554210, partial [Xylaria longipes]